jgi:hypothetical protein
MQPGLKLWQSVTSTKPPYALKWREQTTLTKRNGSGLSDYQRQEAIRRRAAGETLGEIAKSYAVDVSMISRLQA